MAYEKDIGTLINFACEEDHDSDIMILAKAAKLVRKQIFDYQSKFNGSFNECQRTAVLDVLVTLIRMILKVLIIIACTDHPDSVSGI